MRKKLKQKIIIIQNFIQCTIYNNFSLTFYLHFFNYKSCIFLFFLHFFSFQTFIFSFRISNDSILIQIYQSLKQSISFSLFTHYNKKMFKQPLRKNYLLNNQTSIITQRRQQSDSNSHSHSKSHDSIGKKSPNNSFQKIRKDQLKRKDENFNKLPQRMNVMNRNYGNSIKVRSYSINSSYNSLYNNFTKNNALGIPVQINSPKQKIQNLGYNSNLIRKNSKTIQQMFKQPSKLQKLQSQISQISTQPCSLINNFIIDDQRPGFVRFSQVLIGNKASTSKKSRNTKIGSLSILKNRKNAISCNKIDSSYLKFRDKVNEKDKAMDLIKNKYKQIVESLRQKFFKRGGKRHYGYFDLYEQEKYKDQLFPANDQSIFFTKSKIQQIKQKYLNNQDYQFIQIRWKRISQLYGPNLKLVIYKQNSNQKIIKNQFSIASNQFILSLNAIKNVSQFFSKIFQTSCDKYQRHGLYCVKIFQQNTWKSIIIDDFVPVIQIKNKNNNQILSKSLFLDIQLNKNGQQIEVWPYLLQKAYASYYNSFQALHQNFKIIDWLEQILMAPSECYYFPDNEELSQEAVKKLQKNIYQFPSSESIIIGINIKTKQPCIIQKKLSPNSQGNQQVIIKTIKSERKTKIKHLLQIIHTFYLFLPFHFKYFNTCSVNFNKSNKKPLIQHPLTKIKYRDQIFIRTFNINQQGPISISIRQKQKRFYARNSKKYEYIWNRVILIQKQFNNTYRWIQGKYSNQKSLNFNLYLQKGQYEIIILPQVTIEEPLHDLTLIILSNAQLGIERKMYQQGNRLVQNVCCDIAQRKGAYKQLNDYMCSYSLIQKTTGMLIQNVNNQRAQGGVAISRSIGGLKAKVEIHPFNIDFCINEYEMNIHKRKYKKAVDILIDAETHFTVVLMMKGGIDEKFLKVFKFGN